MNYEIHAKREMLTRQNIKLNLKDYRFLNFIINIIIVL